MKKVFAGDNLKPVKERQIIEKTCFEILQSVFSDSIYGITDIPNKRSVLGILTVDSATSSTIQYFQTLERLFLPRMKGECKLSAVDKLISYITTLTPEQVDKVVSQLPQVISAIAEQASLDLQKESLRNQ